MSSSSFSDSPSSSSSASADRLRSSQSLVISKTYQATSSRYVTWVGVMFVTTQHQLCLGEVSKDV